MDYWVAEGRGEENKYEILKKINLYIYIYADLATDVLTEGKKGNASTQAEI